MKRFAALVLALEARTGSDAQESALLQYLAQADPGDAAWAVYLLTAGRPPRRVSSPVLSQAAQRASGLPPWLFEVSLQAAGDLAETIAWVLPETAAEASPGLACWMTVRLQQLRGATAELQMQTLQAWWTAIGADERFVLVKLLDGSFRGGVSRARVETALARHAGIDRALVAQRMMGCTRAGQGPDAAALQRWIAPDVADSAQGGGRPLPFHRAHALPVGWQGDDPQSPSLGAAADWVVEWKYDGVRAQLVRCADQIWLWSSSGELLTGRLPEVEAWAMDLPDGTVLDGVLLVWLPGRGAPQARARLQQRLELERISRKRMNDAPVVFLAFDLLACDGADWRLQPLQARKQRLEQLLAHCPAALAPSLATDSWPGLAAWRQQARSRGMGGLMLKHRGASYGVAQARAPGLQEGGWWKWKLDPLQVDGVLIYAQAGHGRLAGFFAHFTFAVWNRAPKDRAEADAVVQAIVRREPARPGGLQLVPFARADSGLTDAELAQVDAIIRGHALEKFGPVRSVHPTMVMTLGFEGLQVSRRHKSGVALRFPRILRWRQDRLLYDVDSLDELQALLPQPCLPDAPL